MRLVIALTALMFAAGPVQAAPVVAPVVAFLGSGTILASIANIALGLAFNYVASLLAPKPRAPDLIRELGRPNSLPPKRHVYGRVRVPGSPVARHVIGRVLYECHILNSRPSEGGSYFIYIDKRLRSMAGDPFDFGLAGGVETDVGLQAGVAKFWIGLGDQTQPPQQILDETGGYFVATDAWAGQTVLWARMDAGSNDQRSRRWPRVPPQLEVLMSFSRTWDPRDVGQDPDDETTWGFTRNQSLIALDALRNNPIKGYDLDGIDVQSFIDAADIADQSIPVVEGGTQPRYRADGVVIWSEGAEIEQQIEPILDAGVAKLVHIGGQVAIVPGVWRSPSMTLTDVLDDAPIDFQRWAPGRDLPTTVQLKYTLPSRDWQLAALNPYQVPGAVVEDGGLEDIRSPDVPFIRDHRQAARVQKIMAHRFRAQRRVSASFPPEAFKCVPGTVVTLDLGADLAVMNGTYEVESATPTVWVQEGEGVAMRTHLALVEIAEDDFAWSKSEEQDPVGAPDEIDDADLLPPSPLFIVTGEAAALGDVPRIHFYFAPKDDDRVTEYQWQFRVSGGAWQFGPAIAHDAVDGSGNLGEYITPVAVGATYDLRVRAVYIPDPNAANAVTDWAEITGITAAPPDLDLDPPTDGSAAGGDGEIAVSFRSPNSADFVGIEMWGSDSDDVGAATLIAGPLYGPQDTVFSFTEAGLSAGQTRYYFARSVGTYGVTSAFTASASATTTFDPEAGLSLTSTTAVGATINTSALDRVNPAVFAVDFTGLDGSSGGIIAETGRGSTSAFYIGFRGDGTFIARCGHGGAPWNAGTSYIEGAAAVTGDGTLVVEVAPTSIRAWWNGVALTVTANGSGPSDWTGANTGAHLLDGGGGGLVASGELATPVVTYSTASGLRFYENQTVS